MIMKSVPQQIADNQADREAEAAAAALDQEMVANRALLASVPQALAEHEAEAGS
jgi:hypothetical protein